MISKELGVMFLGFVSIDSLRAKVLLRSDRAIVWTERALMILWVRFRWVRVGNLEDHNWIEMND